MYAEPKIIRLDARTDLYAIQDEKGRIAGTGTRQVCEVLIYIIGKLSATNTSSESKHVLKTYRPNVRAAIQV